MQIVADKRTAEAAQMVTAEAGAGYDGDGDDIDLKFHITRIELQEVKSLQSGSVTFESCIRVKKNVIAKMQAFFADVMMDPESHGQVIDGVRAIADTKKDGTIRISEYDCLSLWLRHVREVPVLC